MGVGQMFTGAPRRTRLLSRVGDAGASGVRVTRARISLGRMNRPGSSSRIAMGTVRS
jgi:hypothetical protein